MLDKTTQDWKSLAENLKIEARAFVNGQYQDALAGETRATMNPANGERIADVANCGIEDADHAVSVARSTFESGVWASMAPADRKMVLVRWAELIEDHADEIPPFMLEKSRQMQKTYIGIIKRAIGMVVKVAMGTDAEQVSNFYRVSWPKHSTMPAGALVRRAVSA